MWWFYADEFSEANKSTDEYFIFDISGGTFQPETKDCPETRYTFKTASTLEPWNI